MSSPADHAADHTADAAADRTAIRVSEELFAPLANGVEICYQTFGDPDADPLLLVMGLGGPMNWWDTELCELLAERGFFVIRYDNRDTGRSSRMRGRVDRRMLVRAFLGRPVAAPYSIADMADDAFGLLDHLGIESADVVGASMGGMIAQTMAIARPDRVRSLTSIMSTTGRRTVGWQSPALLPTLIARRGPDREAYIAGSRKVWAIIGSPGFPKDPDDLERRGHETWDRGISREGTLRQMVAVVTQPDRTAQLRQLKMPALVIHGLADRMVHVSGGRSTAMSIPGSELLLIDGMGHDFPEPLFETIASAVRRTADRVTP
ncbi:alpha/beta hydrolase [Nocardioides silvaticus]|uniref:Alpha/beta hydrolase n=1 Tax=Nocardioides silvaticus TaxID=2201891 RepID=A0A316TLU5_9ACTN|nr:alpha/beta hydrolase [Nocardioides silvaticus]PWN04758.1 alpha/beta hydrolase [Nocardioides silvaticus]